MSGENEESEERAIGARIMDLVKALQAELDSRNREVAQVRRSYDDLRQRHEVMAIRHGEQISRVNALANELADAERQNKELEQQLSEQRTTPSIIPSFVDLQNRVTRLEQRATFKDLSNYG